MGVDSNPGLDGPLVGWISYEELERTRLSVCRLGSSRGGEEGEHMHVAMEMGSVLNEHMLSLYN
ncbi:hypothetical protein [Corynebacterium singulare]|uniref:hypothetical protein n=1 Tax=Corynebacterium singulare TaxID=161899 RepID=UPI0011AADC8B|nr:hypothetical protein [Corynebacterium singulare]